MWDGHLFGGARTWATDERVLHCHKISIAFQPILQHVLLPITGATNHHQFNYVLRADSACCSSDKLRDRIADNRVRRILTATESFCFSLCRSASACLHLSNRAGQEKPNLPSSSRRVSTCKDWLPSTAACPLIVGS